MSSAGWGAATPPSLEDFAALAEAALAALPAEFRALTGEVQMRVLDFAEDEVLDELGIEDPFQLTGLYQGPDLPPARCSTPRPRPRWCSSTAARSSTNGASTAR